MKKNARFLSLAMATVLALTQTPLGAVAEEAQSTHECTAVTVISVDEQSHAVSCSDCGVVVTEEHRFGDWRIQDAHCHVRVCSCGASVTQLHTWDAGVTDEASGIVTYTCTACFAASTEEHSPEPANIQIGDIDGDGQITSKDLNLVIDISLGNLPSATQQQQKSADINCDGWVDADDIVSLYGMQMRKG